MRMAEVNHEALAIVNSLQETAGVQSAPQGFMPSSTTRMHSKASGHFNALGFCSIKQETGNLKSIYKE